MKFLILIFFCLNAFADSTFDNVTVEGNTVLSNQTPKGIITVTTLGLLQTEAVQTGNSGKFLTTNGTNISWATIPAAGVTSVAMTVPSFLQVSGSPITSTGTLAVSLTNENANLVMAGPTTGSADVPAFRSLVANDIPNLAASKITSGQLAIAQGGTNGATQTAGFNNLSPVTTKGDIICSNGTDNIRLGVGTNGQLLSSDSTQSSGLKWITASGTGTVTSVALALPSIITVTGSPVTASGTLTGTLATQTANTIFSGPASGGAVAPTFRAMVAADLVAHDVSKLTSGTLAFARGGTGQTTFANQRIPFSNGTILTSDANFIYDTTNNRLTLGGSGTARIGSVVTSGSTVALQAYSSGTNNAFQIKNQSSYAMNIATYSDTNAPSIGVERARGTQVAPTQSLNGDYMLLLLGQGYTGSATSPGFGAAMAYQQTEDCTATANGGEIIFSTSLNTTNTLVERVRITNDGLAKFKMGAMLDTSASQPTCDVAHRGLMWNIQGAAGVADILQICQKSALDTYLWVTK